MSGELELFIFVPRNRHYESACADHLLGLAALGYVTRRD